MKKAHYLFLAILAILLGCTYFLWNLRHSEDNRPQTGKVYIKKTADGYQLYRNGYPFHMQGASGNSHLKELADVGGNTIRVYDTINLNGILDMAEANGLAVIVDIPIPKYNKTYDSYLIDADNNRLKENVKQLVKKYRSHPALLMWNLGNEVEFPLVFRKNSFIMTFNELIDIIHREDPDHLVGTTIPSVSKKQILSIYYHSPSIDILSYNIFGNLKNLRSELNKISFLVGQRPYYISEWGYDGPWEHHLTSWNAPIEPTSTKKVEQLRSNHRNLLQNINSNCLGSLIFYWGEKQERTHTWFSFFLEGHGKSEVVEALKSLWEGTHADAPSLGLDYMLLAEKGSQSDLVFPPNKSTNATIRFNRPKKDSIKISWEIYPEAWNYNLSDKEKKPTKISGAILSSDGDQVAFITPSQEGPYRIFAYIHDSDGNFATTNIPFYVLNPSLQK